ncbi:MAG TPA: dephospho-CoA kinase [Pyrinomonadaceae bacterium]|jgi:dephospho-CoA kinase|nr:dephospho-CoA kinase [Pyrinomonadaceae bacterium]
MLRVGLTGSIAVGKSFVSSALAGLGCHVLDADETAREVVAPGTEGLRAVVATFGVQVLDGEGKLDRARLAAIVFADAEKRLSLNSILHPLIIAAQDEWMRAREGEDPDGVAVIDAALMIETGSYKRFDQIVVVHCLPEVQLGRLMKRGGLTREDAERRVAAQMPQQEKMRHADFLIDTSAGFDDTRRQVERVYEKLRERAAEKLRDPAPRAG